MLHLDIKPDNLFISATGTLKIGDFGMAIQLQQQQQQQQQQLNEEQDSTSQQQQQLNNSYDMNTSRDSNNLSIDEDDVYFDFIEGDSRYLAIEFLNDKKLIGMPSDIFSIGVTFFEMVTGKEMPSNGPLWEQLRDDRATEFLEPNKYSNTLYNCILAMMKSNISERITLDDLLKIDQIKNIVNERKLNPNINRVIQLIPQSPKNQFPMLDKENHYNSPMASLSLKSSAHFIINNNNNNNNLNNSSNSISFSNGSSNNINNLFKEQIQLQSQQLQEQQLQPPAAPKSTIKSMKRVLQDSIDGTTSQKVCAIRRSLDNSLQTEDSTMSPRNLLSLFQDSKKE
ncbi:putative protein tyrosine kinase [Heterostelium album PN500]|uniref:Protein kinase domain-containing protein n=1 Tax=Heterostelium pallidum (strain ATCC 26659 / Pp 5 / PN500) TaxID=670386 RepID=D3AWB8_HETP5|nr:putative protein tyrosine kinase [Heterostelium album PN500]EFA86591.1 putative protein tyrosine kinase [Heterostelium album PN500]|eukprot:XP_020438696.1 putative protein tyrosine kinase [Heterostelium album PN500]